MTIKDDVKYELVESCIGGMFHRFTDVGASKQYHLFDKHFMITPCGCKVCKFKGFQLQVFNNRETAPNQYLNYNEVPNGK